MELRAETSSLRQLNSQLVGELKSTKEAAAAGEKRLEEVVGKLSEAKGQLEEAASSLAALTTERNVAEASKQKLEAEKADLMNVGADARIRAGTRANPMRSPRLGPLVIQHLSRSGRWKAHPSYPLISSLSCKFLLLHNFS